MTLPPMSPNAWLRYDLIRRLLPRDARRILEVGCGQGALGARLAAAGYDYLGIEPDPASCLVAKERLAAVGRGEVRCMAAEDLDAAASYDVVCAFEVLEHLADDAGALAAWVRLLRPAGALLLSAPAHARRFAAADELVGHYRRYDPPELTAKLRAAGLVDVRVRLYGAPLGYLLETARNAAAGRRIDAERTASMAARTGGSGRLLQPRTALLGALTEAGAAPFRLLQRAFPGHGPGLVAAGTRPE